MTTRLPEVSLSLTGSFSTSAWKFWGGALATNGKIYMAPFTTSQTAIGVLDPSTDVLDVTTLQIPDFATDSQWAGAVAGRNGKVYFIPYFANYVLMLNTSNNSISRIGPSLSAAGTYGSKWVGGVLALDGCIYGAPIRAPYILKIDTSTDAVSMIPHTTFTGSVQTVLNSGSFNFRGATLGADGMVYFVPAVSSFVVRFNPVTVTATAISVTGNTWQGGVLAQNGNIYCMPENSTSILVIYTSPTDPLYGTVSYISTSLTTAGNKYAGGTLAPNGKIYAFPSSNPTHLLVLDPSNNSVSLTSLGATFSGSFWGSVLAPNGKVYGVPAMSGQLGVLTVKGLNNIGTWMFSPEMNKF